MSGPYIYYDLHPIKRFCVWLWWLILAYPSYLVTRYMVVGGNFAAKKSALLQIGGFDTNIAFYGEDTDIARRLSKVGKVRFLATLFMYTSARRFHGEGIAKTGYFYLTNFISVAILKRPIKGTYNDIR